MVYIPGLACDYRLSGDLSSLIVDDKVLLLCHHGAELRYLVADGLLLVLVLLVHDHVNGIAAGDGCVRLAKV